jgi:hypothetical protein
MSRVEGRFYDMFQPKPQLDPRVAELVSRGGGK